MMRHHTVLTVLSEPLVGRNQQALFPLRHLPQGVILHVSDVQVWDGWQKQISSAFASFHFLDVEPLGI